MNNKNNENNVIDLMPKLRALDKNIIERAADAFLETYEVVGVEAAFDFLHHAIEAQFRQQILDLANEKLDISEREKIEDYITG